MGPLLRHPERARWRVGSVRHGLCNRFAAAYSRPAREESGADGEEGDAVASQLVFCPRSKVAGVVCVQKNLLCYKHLERFE
ncbi:protein of unknown function [Paraburkholderia kururiensis]